MMGPMKGLRALAIVGVLMTASGCDGGESNMQEFVSLHDRVVGDAKDQLPVLAGAWDVQIDGAQGSSQERVAATIGDGTYGYGVEAWMSGPAPADGELADAVESLGYTDLQSTRDAAEDRVTGTSTDGEVTMTATYRTLSGEPAMFIVTLESTGEVELSREDARDLRAKDFLGRKPITVTSPAP